MINNLSKQKSSLRLRFYLNTLVKSNIKDKDVARRAFVLNVLLIGSLLLSVIASVTSWIQAYTQNNLFRFESLQNTIIVVFFLLGYLLSRAGYSKIISYVFIFFYLALNIEASYRWGAILPQSILTYALIVVMSGILVNSKFAFIITTIVSGVLLILTHIQSHNYVQQMLLSASIRDGVVFSITLYIIAIVSWLFNREGEAALKRARISDRELQKERDSLAIKVEEKTRELRQEQTEKIVQLYKFAEFGKSASAFLHDLSNSVNLVAANLKQLEDNKNNLQDMKTFVSRAKIGTKRLETFISMTRKQVHNQDFLEYFFVDYEISQAIEILKYKAKKANVEVIFNSDTKIRTYGNTIKFNQFMCNFISNAIDAYDGSRKKVRTVNIKLSAEMQHITIHIIDLGKGITKKTLSKIFVPFFSTKGYRKGTGIGLSISHDIVTKDFNGVIEVDSKPYRGTTFTISFPLREKF